MSYTNNTLVVVQYLLCVVVDIASNTCPSSHLDQSNVCRLLSHFSTLTGFVIVVIRQRTFLCLSSSMSGYPPAKKQQMSAQGPLNDAELSTVTGLLHRAIKHGQSFQLYGYFKDSLVEKAHKEPGKKFLQDLQSEYDKHKEENQPCGSMTDAAKRRHDIVEDGVSSASSDWEGLSSISQNSRPLGSTDNLPKKWTWKNKDIPLPPGTSFAEWSASLCTLNKVKHLNMSYMELVQKSGTDLEIHDYLKWVKNTHGPTSSNYLRGKLTQVMDFAVFLEAVEWNPRTEDKEPSERTTFTRRVKK